MKKAARLQPVCKRQERVLLRWAALGPRGRGESSSTSPSRWMVGSLARDAGQALGHPGDGAPSSGREEEGSGFQGWAGGCGRGNRSVCASEAAGGCLFPEMSRSHVCSFA